MKKKSVLIMSSVRWYNASAHYALFLAENLRISGFDVVLFGITVSPFIVKAKEKGFDVIDDINLMERAFLRYFRNLFRFRKLLKQRHFDIINPHISRDHVFAFLSLGCRKRRIIRTRTDSRYPKKHILNRAFYRISASYYIVSSEYMVSYISGLGIHRDRIHVIPLEINYRDFTDYRPARDLKSELKIPGDRLVVSFIGRLDKVKGVEHFIRSYAALKNKQMFYYLVSGDEINISIHDLERLADEMKLADISFTGRVDDVRDILFITDIGVIPSVGSESICRIGLEMLSFGIPVIGSNVNSIPEMISAYGGIVVDPGAPGEIAEALDYLADKDNLKRMREKIKEKMQDRAPDKFTVEYADIFSKMQGD